METGRILSIVCKREDQNKLFFKFYDYKKYRTPPTTEDHYGYILCSGFMTNDVKKILIEWEGPKEFTGKALIGRKVQRKFSDGFFTGTIRSYDSGAKLYSIQYDDGDYEETTERTILSILKA